MDGSELQHPETRVMERWGNWTLDRAEGLLIHAPSQYRVDFLHMSTCAGMLDIIFQVESKSVISSEDLGDLLHALADIFHPQANLCPNGIERDFDAPAHFARVLMTGYPSRKRPTIMLEKFPR